MKRIALILLAITCALCFAGCGDKNNNNDNPTPGTSNSVGTTHSTPAVTTTTERTNTLESDLGMIEDDIQNGISDVGEDMGMNNNDNAGNAGNAAPAR